jgi:hypothetical protein
MAEAGLFIGWGEPVTGREAKGLEVFAEALNYWATGRRRSRPCFCHQRGSDYESGKAMSAARPRSVSARSTSQ